MKIGALIPARNGSKRVPKKNIRLLGDKPLVCWTVDVLLQSEVFDTITISTESQEVASVVNEYYPGDKVQVLTRPDCLAGDNSSLDAVMEHYLSTNDYEYFGLFMPTYPFRRVSQLRKAAYAVQSRYPWRILSQTIEQYPSMDYFYPTEEGVKRVFKLHPMMCPATTSTYLMFNRHCYGRKWMQTGITAQERVYHVKVDEVENIDIDTPDDFARAELVAKGQTPVLRPPVTTRFGEWATVTPKGADPEAFLDFIGRDKLKNVDAPVLLLGKANPPLNFYTIMQYGARMYYIDRQANSCFLSKAVEKTGNSKHIPTHYLHDQHYRLLRVPQYPADNAHKNWPRGTYDETGFPHGMYRCDDMGLYFGSEFGDEVLPDDRVVLSEDLIQQDFYVDPYEYI